MGKQRKGEKVGSGNVTPVQIAVVVDRYLSDNNYTQTLTSFRSEASNLISGAKIKEAPRTLLSLSDILNEYITLKEQKLSLNHERALLDQEKCRVEKLLQGMQAVIQSYQSVGTASPSTTYMEQRSEACAMPNTSANFTPVFLPTVPTSTPTPVTSNPSRNKRKNSGSIPGASSIAKKSCTQIPTDQPALGGTKEPLQVSNSASNPGIVQQFNGYSRFQSTSYSGPQNGVSSVQGSSVAKSLFRQPPQAQNDSTCPKTPPQEFPSQNDNSDSPFETPSLIANAMPLLVTPTNNLGISSEKVTETPSKLACHSMDGSQYVSSLPPKLNTKRPGKRDHIKSRLDFDDSIEPANLEIPSPEVSTPATDTETDDMFDDIPDFNVLGQDFSLSGFLLDITLDSYPYHSELPSTTEVLTSSPNEPRDDSFITNSTSADNAVSSFFGILSERDTNKDHLTSKQSNSTAKSSITNTHGKKDRLCFGDQENIQPEDN